MRYLDSREDEQERGITMESSTISLSFELQQRKYLINLIDSPGHVDFSADVSMAVRLCDGALLVVDVVEGVCIQTHAVLRQAYEERLRPCLVLNKMDRLITELDLTPKEAYEHLARIIEQVNAITSSFLNSEWMGQETHTEFDAENKELDMFFAPEKGNVVFASAIDGWGFRVLDRMDYLTKTKFPQFSKRQLCKVCWGEYYFNGKKVYERTKTQRDKPTMFTQFILRPIYEMYKQTLKQPDNTKYGTMCEVLDLKPVHQRQSPRQRLKLTMSQWLPLSHALLAMVVRCVPNPREAQQSKAEAVYPKDTDPSALTTIQACDPDSEDVVVFVSKMIAIRREDLADGVLLASIDNEDSEEVFVAIARVFSGTLRVGMSGLKVLGPKHDPLQGVEHVQDIPPHTIQPLLIMGTQSFPQDAVPAGSICGILGLGQKILKTATLSSSITSPSLSKMSSQAAPILRVSVQPKQASDWPALQEGLRLLNRADGVVEIKVQADTGEHLLCVIGELHLERCIKDLTERFAKVDVVVSPPIATFKETIVSGVFGEVCEIRTPRLECDLVMCGITDEKVVKVLSKDLFPEDGVELGGRRVKKENVLQFGQLAPNLLICDEDCPLAAKTLFDVDPSLEGDWVDVANGLFAGFHLATKNGPLCGEPIWGCCFYVQSITILDVDEEEVQSWFGSTMSASADLCLRAFVGQQKLGHSRLVEAIMACNFQCNASEGDSLGKLYGLISAKRGTVLAADMVEGTTIFTIYAWLPMIESFGLAQDLRAKTSGAATSPQLVFDRWEVLDTDPFHYNVTELDLDLEGETTDLSRVTNLAFKYITLTRKRKGIATNEKIVVSAEKQRTRTRMK